MYELIIDNFAGGGGASTGIEAALGQPIDVAVNHDVEAVAMHEANHPDTLHLCQSVWKADPRDVVAEASIRRGSKRPLPVGLAWFSPDCKHFSKAKGGQPVKRHIRDLAWVVVHYAKLVKPRVILLENVEEFRDWGPLIEVEDGKMMPCPLRKGLHYRRWKRELQKLGYKVEAKEMRASDYGAPTSRNRLYVVARCDGLPIVWPAPTHGKGLRPFRTAADCIDWSIPCPSIFGRKHPLVENTMKRIALGVKRYVLDDPRPFIVPVTHHGDARVHGIDEPLRTVTTAQRGEFALVSAFMEQANTDMVGHRADTPMSTIVQKGCTQRLVTAQLAKAGDRQDEVRAFLVKYFGTAIGQPVDEPLHTATTKARFGLVTVQGEPYQIVDIGMRMLTPRELFRAQGFPETYELDPWMPAHERFDGTQVKAGPLTKSSQIRMCGNSVCPPVAEAMVRANYVAMPAAAIA